MKDLLLDGPKMMKDEYSIIKVKRELAILISLQQMGS